jgi:hypothetical protein
MPVLFKIFLFFLLQQGVKTVPDNCDPSTSPNTVLLTSSDVTLMVASNSELLEEVINLCTLLDNSCEVKRETVTQPAGVQLELINLSFKNLSIATRYKIMERLQPMQNKVSLQWIVQ